jgi:hypothetical protein
LPHVMCRFEQLLSMLACSNQAMAIKRENPGMWINPKSNLSGGEHSLEYGEGQSTHNSRFLELADVVLSKDKPANKAKAAIAGQGSKK